MPGKRYAAIAFEGIMSDRAADSDTKGKNVSHVSFLNVFLSCLHFYIQLETDFPKKETWHV